MKIIGVNGIRTDGSASTDRLLADLATRNLHAAAGAAIDLVDFYYPRVNLLTARCRGTQRRNGRSLRDDSRAGDHVIAHSYGALVVLRAMQAGAEYGAVFFFSPALDRDVVFPYRGAEKIHVIHHPGDVAIGLGALLWRHDFGAMGAEGYAGPPDDRVINVAASQHARHSDPLKHSCYFDEHNRPRWVSYITQQLRIHGYA